MSGFLGWLENHRREAASKAAIRAGHGLVSLPVPPPVPARGPLTDAEAGPPVPADYDG